MEDVFQTILSGKKIDISSKEFSPAIEKIYWAHFLCQKINTCTGDFTEIRGYLDELFENRLPKTAVIIPQTHIYFPNHMFVGENVFVNHNSTFMAAGGIYIGDGCFIGPNVSIVTDNHEFCDLKYLKPKGIKIGNRVWIGANAVILPGVTIGDDAVIGGGAVVTSDVEEKTLVAGNPAHFIKKIDRHS